MSTYVSSSFQKAKATRTSAPKSRNGCTVCKARRMKCDEGRPSCKYCIKSGFQCQYMNKKAEPKPKSPRVILPQSESVTTLSQIRPSDTLKFIDQREVYYFWSYQEQAARELTGCLKSSPWAHTLLQACHYEPFVLRSVVAIGALSRSIKVAHQASQCSASDSLHHVYQEISSQHRNFALATYARAIAGMRQLQLGPGGPLTLKKALMACLLVHCIEVHMRSPATGYAQTHAGYNLMQQWIIDNHYRDTGIASPNAHEVDDDLFHELSRLETQHARWVQIGLERHTARKHEATEAVRDMPSKFSNLEEARAYQELIVRRTVHLLGEIYARITKSKINLRHPPTVDTPGEINDPCYLPDDLLPERDAYMLDLRRWREAFSPISEALLSSADAKEAMSASLLIMEALHSEITLAGAFFTEECSYDIFFPHYQEIVSLSRIVSQRESEIFPEDIPTFQLSAGTAWCLYDTASTCRDPVIRKEALSMLRAQAEKDHTKYKARLVMHAGLIISLEEQGQKVDFIPESSRYRRLWELNPFEDDTGALTFICARKLGYPIGKGYPAEREWRITTLPHAEVISMKLGEIVDTTWPYNIASAKPSLLKWSEIHSELLEATSEARLALDSPYQRKEQGSDEEPVQEWQRSADGDYSYPGLALSHRYRNNPNAINKRECPLSRKRRPARTSPQFTTELNP